MTTKALCLLTLAALAGTAAAQTPSDAEKKLINKLMQQQDIIAVNDVAAPQDFVPDKNPNTLQVVILTSPDAKASVSDDGEVVFMPPDLSTNQQGTLTYEAFRRKAARIMAITLPPPPNVVPPSQ